MISLTHRDPPRCKGVIELGKKFRTWMVLVAAGTLMIAAIRL